MLDSLRSRLAQMGLVWCFNESDLADYLGMVGFAWVRDPGGGMHLFRPMGSYVIEVTTL